MSANERLWIWRDERHRPQVSFTRPEDRDCVGYIRADLFPEKEDPADRMERDLREMAQICPYCYHNGGHYGDCPTRQLSAKLHDAMRRRRALIAACPGFNSGATDRSAPVFRELGLLDQDIMCIAHSEGFTELQAWKLFAAKDGSK